LFCFAPEFFRTGIDAFLVVWDGKIAKKKKNPFGTIFDENFGALGGIN
jgi:hypothetical protein